ncbi:MAG: hypothetical protein ACR2IS_11475 [Nitrososphaeraceae archaeon]
MHYPSVCSPLLRSKPTKTIFALLTNLVMSVNIQKSTSLGRIAEDITHLKQQLEYFERHVHNIRNEEVKKEFFRTLSKVLEAEKALRHFGEVFNNSK